MARPTKLTPTQKEVPVKANDEEIILRVESVYKMILKGKTRAQILRNAAENWGVAERQGEEYLSRARALMLEDFTKERQEHLALAVERMNMVFGVSFDASDYQGAISAQREINKIIGLYAPVQQHIDIHVTWQDEAVSLIKAGEITYEAALETFDHDDRLVRDLFAKAQVPISIGQSEAD